MATAAQIASLKAQAQAIQNNLNNAVKSGAIKSTPTTSTTGPSAQLKALSIANSKPTTNGTTTNGTTTSGTTTSTPSSSGGSSLRDLSIALANNVPVTQAQINSGSLPKTGTAAAPINAYASQTTGLPSQTAQTTQAPTTPVTNADTFYQKLISSLTPTTAENNLTNQQTTLDSTLRNLNQGQGVMDANITDQPIALPFIVGQKAAVERRYALQRGDVQNQQQTTAAQLANLQRQRQAAIDVAKAGLDYTQNADQLAATKAQQATTNALNQAQFDAQQTQQQYQNTTQASQYADSLAQQKLANQIALSKANNGSSPKRSTQVISVDGKQILVDTQTGQTISVLGNSTPDKANALQENISLVHDRLSPLTGGDGFVSPTDYKKAKAAWTSSGEDPSKFDVIFNEFINPKNIQDYTG